MRKEALDAMMPYFLEEYANPSSIHGMSRTPRAAIQKARGQIAECLNADPKEIYFTSGGRSARSQLNALILSPVLLSSMFLRSIS